MISHGTRHTASTLLRDHGWEKTMSRRNCRTLREAPPATITTQNIFDNVVR
jgi:hypothetical protein